MIIIKLKITSTLTKRPSGFALYVPVKVAETAGLVAGDKLSWEVTETGEIILKKEKSNDGR